MMSVRPSTTAAAKLTMPMANSSVALGWICTTTGITLAVLEKPSSDKESLEWSSRLTLQHARSMSLLNSLWASSFHCYGELVRYRLTATCSANAKPSGRYIYSESRNTTRIEGGRTCANQRNPLRLWRVPCVRSVVGIYRGAGAGAKAKELWEFCSELRGNGRAVLQSTRVLHSPNHLQAAQAEATSCSPPACRLCIRGLLPSHPAAIFKRASRIFEFVPVSLPDAAAALQLHSGLAPPSAQSSTRLLCES